MNIKLIRGVFYVCIFSLGIVPSINAAVVTTNFSGTIDWISINTGAADTHGIGTSTMMVGDTFSYSITYDSDPTVAIIGFDGVGTDYEFDDSPYGGSLSVNGNNFSSLSSALNVGNDVLITPDITFEQEWLDAGFPSDITGSVIDGYWMGVTSDGFIYNSSGEFQGLQVSVQFFDLAGTILSSDSIPDFVPSLNTIDFAFFNIEQWENGVSVFKAGGVLANNYSAVPIPAAVWLFGSGLIGLIGIARRKTHL